MSEFIGRSKYIRRIAVAGAILGAALSAESSTANAATPNITAKASIAAKPPVSAKLNNGFIEKTRTGSAPKVRGNETLPRCYEEPLQPQFNFGAIGEIPSRKNFKSDEAYDNAINNYSINLNDSIKPTQGLTIPFSNGMPESMPTAEASPSVLNSIVKIEFGESWGSGFVTEDSYGNDVVVTAAHVGAVAPLDSYSIYTRNGHEVKPTGGCYIYENINLNSNTNSAVESFIPFLAEGQGSVSEDLAILTIPKGLGAKALEFSNNQPQRGSWVEFTNFQTGSSLQNPANFYGLTTSTTPFAPFETLTGLSISPNESIQEQYVNRIEAGASGGLVTEDNKIVGESYAGDGFPGTYLSQAELATDDQVTLPGANYGFNTGVIPAHGSVITNSTLELGLESPNA